MRRREALALLGAATPAWADAPALRFAIGQTWGPPFVTEGADGRLRGLLIDLVEAIAREAGRPAELHSLPALRVAQALESGAVDLQCPMNPAWWGQPVPDLRRWSAPLLTMRDVLVAAPGTSLDWPGFLRARRLVVGTVHGYLYPPLQADFDAGRLRRDDAPNQAAQLRKLERGRSPVAVVNELVLRAHNRALPAAQRLRVVAVIDEVKTYCLLAPNPRGGIEALRAAIRRATQADRLAPLIGAEP
ncbi:substrate-binding periplasmic protein [Inhella proteolytica]|uniref:substrate-binding periplasmic protein n=1 Tax=Inhella proteolytica TaxID=2795029 RepID=UPI0018DE39F3|nr:transporter substrate-binding domain-containing protein [Inhella proteolytica]